MNESTKTRKRTEKSDKAYEDEESPEECVHDVSVLV